MEKKRGTGDNRGEGASGRERSVGLRWMKVIGESQLAASISRVRDRHSNRARSFRARRLSLHATQHTYHRRYTRTCSREQLARSPLLLRLHTREWQLASATYASLSRVRVCVKLRAAAAPAHTPAK